MLARGNTDGVRAFDTSISGFWRSFSAIIVIAPIYLVILRAELERTGRGAALGHDSDIGFYFSQLASLGVDWLAWPIAMVFLARLLGLGERYAGYVVVYNWSTLLIASAYLLPALLFVVGVLPNQLAAAINLVVWFWALYFHFYVARHLLATTLGTAIGLVIVNMLLSFMINVASNDLYTSAFSSAAVG